MMPSSSVIVLRNMVRKMNGGKCVCWLKRLLGVSGVNERDMRGSGDDFVVSFGLCYLE